MMARVPAPCTTSIIPPGGGRTFLRMLIVLFLLDFTHKYFDEGLDLA